jgi:micrococcal nuclease
MRLNSPHSTALLVLLPALILLACSSGKQDTESAHRAPTATPYVRSGLTPAEVTRVVDGDTIRVEVNGVEYRVRYIGIDTPETGESGARTECFSREATERNRGLVEGQVVGLEKDVSETDGFDRLLRYVWIEDLMVNSTLVAEGFALASTYPPDVRYSGRFADLQTQAQQASRGLWGTACGAP